MNLTDLQAALGLTQLKQKEDLLSKRNFLVEYYNEILEKFDWIEKPVFKTEKKGKWEIMFTLLKFLIEEH